MELYKVTLLLCKPNDVSEQEMDEALANAIYKLGGEIIDSKEYENIGNYPSSLDK